MLDDCEIRTVSGGVYRTQSAYESIDRVHEKVLLPTSSATLHGNATLQQLQEHSCQHFSRAPTEEPKAIRDLPTVYGEMQPSTQ